MPNILLLVLSLADAVLTLIATSRGAPELNPLLALLLGWYAPAFVVAKLGVGTFAALALRHARALRWAVAMDALMGLVVCYELAFLAMVR
jgi:hypothetical protein